jgi:hypothetical protein
VSDVTEAPWIRGYALAPRRLSEGGWVWLRPYEWRWQRPDSALPSALNPPQVFSRKSVKRARMQAAESR